MDALSTRVASRKFETVKRGYDPQAVDSWLSKVGDEVAKLEDALRVARSQVDDLERRTRKVSNADTVVSTAFLAAADSKAKLIAEAEERARDIIAAAEQRAAMLAGGSGEPDRNVEEMLREAKLRLEESERFATARRAEAEREAAAIIEAAKQRVAETEGATPDHEADAAADELGRLVQTLGSLKEAARKGLEEVASLDADIDAVIGDE